jgi:hypothetical protein
MTYEIIPAVPEDAEEILLLQKLACRPNNRREI